MGFEELRGFMYVGFKIHMYDRKTRKGQTRYLVGYLYRTRGQEGGHGPDAGCMTKVWGIGKHKES